jgi:flagellar biosynthetic protein FlhB
MADNDRSQRTFAPTPKRKKEFKSEGRVARSQDVSAALSLVGAVLLLRVFGPSMVNPLVDGTKALLASSGQGLSGAPLREDLPPMLIGVIAPVLAVAVVLGLVANIGQVGFVFAPKAVKPKLSKISPKQGIQRFAPAKMAWEVGRLVLKLGLLAVIVIGPIQQLATDVTHLRGLDSWLNRFSGLLSSVLIRAAGLAIVIAAADYGYNRYKHVSQLKMTREEVKKEAKDQEGDAHLKGARRSRARELSRNRMIRDVSAADVVLVNPIRFAVALKYVENEVAPRVVAKGAGAMARKIRQEAYRNAVPVRQDQPLARALYRKCQVGHFVPAELYEAVAVVLAAVMRRRRTLLRTSR